MGAYPKSLFDSFANKSLSMVNLHKTCSPQSWLWDRRPRPRCTPDSTWPDSRPSPGWRWTPGKCPLCAVWCTPCTPHCRWLANDWPWWLQDGWVLSGAGSIQLTCWTWSAIVWTIEATHRAVRNFYTLASTNRFLVVCEMDDVSHTQICECVHWFTWRNGHPFDWLSLGALINHNYWSN